MSDQRPGTEIIERDIDFDQIFDLLRIVNRREAKDLLRGTLRVAFNNGEAFGMESMAKIADNAIASVLTAGKHE